MLKKLIVKNYALIRDLDLDLPPELIVVTGETGAGKSILLGALSLLTGQRADSSVLWEKDKKCIVEGWFDISKFELQDLFEQLDLDYDDQTIIRREITASGKSRAFINDTPVNLTETKAVAKHLLDVHAQHDHLKLSKQQFHLEIIDAYAGNTELLEKYRTAYGEFKAIDRELKQRKANLSAAQKDLDYLSFQLAELEDLGLAAGFQEQAEAKLNKLENADTIQTSLKESNDLLEDSDFSVLNNMRHILANLERLPASPNYQTLLRRMNEAYLELKDLQAELTAESQEVELNPKEQELITAQLNELYRVQKKHGVNTESALLAVHKSIAAQVLDLNGFEDDLQVLEQEYKQQQEKCLSLANLLSFERKKAAPELLKATNDLLADLGMPDAKLSIKNEVGELGERGIDQIEMLFASNLGSLALPISKVASGGEKSRLMLILKSIVAQQSKFPTLIFDEIDTGISGKIAAKAGKLLKTLAREQQLINITHLPQVAAQGAAHLFVYKENVDGASQSKVKWLTHAERVEEIAKMLSDTQPGKFARKNAEELLK